MKKIYIVTMLEVKGRKTQFATVRTYDTADAAAEYVCRYTHAATKEGIVKGLAERGDYTVHCKRKERPLEVFSIETCILEEATDKEKAS